MKKGFFINEDGEWLLTPTAVTNFGECLKALAESMGRKVPSAFLLDGKPVGVTALTGGVTLAAVQLPHVDIDTHWKIDGEDLYPVFASSKDTVDRKFRWTPPADMKLTFCLVASGSWIKSDALLFAKKTGGTGFWRLPLPNTYTDGRLCLGEERTIRGNTLAECLDNAVRRFHEAKWNTDLLSDQSFCKKLFRFSMTGEQRQVPNWEECCFRVNTAYIEEAS